MIKRWIRVIGCVALGHCDRRLSPTTVAQDATPLLIRSAAPLAAMAWSAQGRILRNRVVG